MSAPHEDNLRVALHEADVLRERLERCVELTAADQPVEPDWRSAVERIDALHAIAHRCPVCGDTGLIANDINCGCPAGDRYRDVPVAAPRPEVKG